MKPYEWHHHENDPAREHPLEVKKGDKLVHHSTRITFVVTEVGRIRGSGQQLIEAVNRGGHTVRLFSYDLEEIAVIESRCQNQ